MREPLKHINLLVDTMCVSGHVAPVNKRGMQLIGHDFLSSMAFESPINDIVRTFY